MQLSGKVAIVTGTGRGIGRAIANRFAAEGAAVVLAARTESDLENSAAEIGQAGDGRHGWLQMFRWNQIVNAFCARPCGKFGQVNILVNNAGIYGPVKPIEEISPAGVGLRRDLESARCFPDDAAPAARVLRARRRCSTEHLKYRGEGGFGWGAAYAAAKAALLGLTRTTAAEGARQGVRANAICPGPVPETKMSQELGQGLARRAGRDADEMLQEFLKGILQGRPQTADEIAAAALFLVSDQSSAITGQALNVDGGMLFC